MVSHCIHATMYSVPGPKKIFFGPLWKYTCNMVKMKIIAEKKEAEYGEGILSGATRFKWYREGKCSFLRTH